MTHNELRSYNEGFYKADKEWRKKIKTVVEWLDTQMKICARKDYRVGLLDVKRRLEDLLGGG